MHVSAVIILKKLVRVARVSRCCVAMAQHSSDTVEIHIMYIRPTQKLTKIDEKNIKVMQGTARRLAIGVTVESTTLRVSDDTDLIGRRD